MNPNENKNDQNVMPGQQETIANDSSQQSASGHMSQHGPQQPPQQIQPIAPTTQYAPPVNTAHDAGQATQKNVNAGLITLQWLTYAFWGWTLLALSALTVSIISHVIDKNGNDGSGLTPYGIAAVLVLLPISFICDAFYAPREPVKKSGVETLVMVVHAVIFALFGIGSLIAAVIAGVMLLTDTGSSNQGVVTTLFSALIITVYYGLTFIRTLNLRKGIVFSKYYKLIMLVTVGLIALLGLIGPVATERSTRSDRLISNNISELSNDINSYASAKKRLPTNLNELSNLNEDSKKIVNENLVSYKPEGVVSNTDKSSKAFLEAPSAQYKYQLCVTYTKASQSSYSSSNYDDLDEYKEYPDAFSHPSGNVCYKLKTRAY